MASIYDKASLVMIPSGSKEGKLYSQKPTNGDGDFTFSRSTAATRVNASGNIEKETQNLLVQSNTFDTTWINNLGGAVTGGQAGYDGTNNAWEINKNTTSFRRIEQSGLSLSGIWTLSVYAKAGTLDVIALRNFVGGDRAEFNLTSGTITNQGGGTIIARSMTDVGNGWYRCSITCNSTSTQIQIYVDWNQTIGGNIYIQDAQLEYGLVARDYIETTTTAIYGGITDNVPRLDYTDSSCPALLLEPQRTNLATQSEYFIDIFTENSGVTWESNSTTSPEGLVNASKLNNSNAGSSGAYYVPLAFTDNDTMTASIFAKEGDVSELLFGITNQNESKSLYYSFDLSAGTATYNANNGGILNVSGSIVDYGNGWYRCIVTGTFPSSGTTSGGVFPRIPQAGYVYLYGLQVEKNVSYATSYIPTYGSAVTRNQDSCNKTGVSDLIGQPNGSIFLDFVYDNNTSNTRIFSVTGANWFTNGSIRLEKVSNLFRWNWLKQGVGGASLDSTTTMVKGTRYKMVITYTDSVCSLFINGTKEDTSACDTPTNLSGIYLNELGGGYSDGWEFQKNIFNQVLMFNTTLTDQEAIDLTTL